ncbi:MAG: GNAT family N-acetyltransferase [Acidimicrobiales bacterium]
MEPVHLVGPEDVPAAAMSLVRAFYDDPLLEYMFPEARSRRRALHRFFTLQLRETPKGRGLAYTSEGCHSTALWLPPRNGPPGAREVLAQLPKLYILGRRAGAALRLVQLVEPRHPKTPHFYLGGLGTDPEWQHRGLGSAVLVPVLERCDRESKPAYLEVSVESNIAFYSRRGFEVIGDVAVPDTSVHLWLMWRDPRPASELDNA